jgi:hypothetical protein
VVTTVPKGVSQILPEPDAEWQPNLETPTGRAQPLDAPVLTLDGYRPIGSLAIGDTLASIDGQTSTVTGIYPQGRKQVFKITLADGRTVRATDHIQPVVILTPPPDSSLLLWFSARNPSPLPQPSMHSPASQAELLKQIQEAQDQMGRARRKWVLNDPVEADHQMRRNREMRLKIEGPPVLSSSYGW